MQQVGINMYDIRAKLRIKSVKSKIEKRVLERIGHVLRMESHRTVRNITTGWIQKVEGMKKASARGRCTHEYWRKLVKEAGWNITTLELLARDRAKYKEKVGSRMAKIYQWEAQQEKASRADVGISNPSNRKEEQNTSLECPICQKQCKSKAGLAIHTKRMHKNTNECVEFSCGMCGKKFQQKSNFLNHQKKCVGPDQLEGERKYRAKKKRCSGCGSELSATNMARHKRRCLGS